MNVRGDACADKAKDFIGKGCLSGEQQGKGTQENCSATWLAVSGFMVVELAFRVVSGQSSCLAHIWSDSGPFLVACISQPRWSPEQGFLGVWQDILWAGISSLLLASPEFFQLAAACQFHVPYRNLLL